MNQRWQSQVIAMIHLIVHFQIMTLPQFCLFKKFSLTESLTENLTECPQSFSMRTSCVRSGGAVRRQSGGGERGGRS